MGTENEHSISNPLLSLTWTQRQAQQLYQGDTARGFWRGAGRTAMVGMPTFCEAQSSGLSVSTLSTLRQALQSDAKGHRNYLGPTLGPSSPSHSVYLDRSTRPAGWQC